MTFFTKTKLGVLLLFFPFLSLAQNTAFWGEDFSDHTGTSLPDGWTTNDVSNNTIQTLWQRCGIPEECPPDTITDSFIRDNFKSSTVSNGYAFSFSRENDDLEENHISQLSSPQITLPNLTDELYLEFQSFLITIHTREHAGTRLYVQADGGDWEEHEIYPDVPNYDSPRPQKTHNANSFFIDLSQYADANNIRLRWEWLGNKEIIWCLDDCKLLDYNPLDTRKIWDSGGFMGGINNDWEIVNTNASYCSWEWEAIGSYGDALLPDGNDNKFINSPTFRTGTAVVNGDNCYTDNIGPAPGAPPLFRSELISPTIDLSATNEQVILDFYQVIRKIDNTDPSPIASPMLFSYSIDNGTTWSVDEPLNELYPSNLTFHTHESLLLPIELIGQADVKLKFTFDGMLFYWGLDDIRILERAPNDMRISKDFFAIPPNYSTPVSQLDSIPFLADIENFGTETQSDIWLHIEIENTDTENIVYRDSLFIPSAAPLELVENQLFSTAFFPPAFPAHYKGTYRVESSMLDDIPTNNAISFNFEVTENSFAKEKKTSFGFTPLTRDFSWGNAFYITNGGDYYADSVFFTITNLEQMAGLIVQTELYEWTNNDEDILRATPDEYGSEPVAINIKEISVTSPELMGIPVNFTGQPFQLKDNTQYFIVLKYQQQVNDNTLCFLATSQESDYLATHFASGLRNDLRYATMLSYNATDVFEIFGAGNGSGFDYIPQIRLSIVDSLTSIAEVPIEKEVLKLYPNPANTAFSINLPIDLKGKVLIYNNLGTLTRTLNEFSVGDNISIEDFPKGTYFVHFIEEKTKQIMVGKLVKM